MAPVTKNQGPARRRNRNSPGTIEFQRDCAVDPELGPLRPRAGAEGTCAAGGRGSETGPEAVWEGEVVPAGTADNSPRFSILGSRPKNIHSPPSASDLG